VARYNIAISTDKNNNVDILKTIGGHRTIVYLLVIVLFAALLVAMPQAKATTNFGPATPGMNPTANLIWKKGTTVGGYPCAKGLRQIPWSHYSPWCEPAWHGNNGGATAPGVTASTITITYREASSQDLNLAYGIIPKEVIGTNQKAIYTMQVYVNLFNKLFELYGRHVVLVPFQGQSDFIQETIGADTQKVEADARTVATKIKAFADISLIDSTAIYDQYLTQFHVINFNLGFLPQSYYQSNAPYSYTTGPDCDKVAEGDAGVLARAFNNLPPIYAGEAQMRQEPSRIAIIAPESSTSGECTTRLLHLLSQDHVNVVTVVRYILNFSTLSQDISNLVAQLKSANASVVVCASCDPVSPRLVLNQAFQDGYAPFWYTEAAGAMSGGIDAFGQIQNQPEVIHAILATQQTPPKNLSTEAWRAYIMGGGNPNEHYLEPLYPLVYEQLFMLFSGLQAAGPDLNPTTFQAGIQSLPPSTPGGEFGVWKYGYNIFDPQASFQLGIFDPNVLSPVDGQEGEFVACENGLQILYQGQASNLPNHKPLICSYNPPDFPNV